MIQQIIGEAPYIIVFVVIRWHPAVPRRHYKDTGQGRTPTGIQLAIDIRLPRRYGQEGECKETNESKAFQGTESNETAIG